jgi:hypothetical protein
LKSNVNRNSDLAEPIHTQEEFDVVSDCFLQTLEKVPEVYEKYLPAFLYNLKILNSTEKHIHLCLNKTIQIASAVSFHLPNPDFFFTKVNNTFILFLTFD